MARKAIKGAIGIAALGQGAQGFASGIQQGLNLQMLLAQRALEQEKMNIARNQSIAETKLKIAQLGQDQVMFDALGNQTTIGGMRGVTVDDNTGAVTFEPDYSPGVKTVKSAPTPKQQTTVIPVPKSQFLANPAAYQSGNPGVRYDIVPDAVNTQAVPQGLLKTFNDFNASAVGFHNAETTLRNNPNLVTSTYNPVANRGLIGKAARNLPGIKQAFQVDPGQAAFVSQVARNQDTYRHAVTGAAASFSELNWLESAVPTTSIDRDNFLSTSIGAKVNSINNAQQLVDTLKTQKKYDTSELENRLEQTRMRVLNFKDEAAVAAAEKQGLLPSGTKIYINGRPAVVE